MDILRFLCGILGNAVGLSLYLAPMTTFKRIIKNRSTEQFSGVPYMVTLLSCSLYTWYGLPFVSSDNLLLLIISIMGVVIELTYVLIFITYAPKKKRAKITGFCGLALILILTFALVSLFILHGKTRKLFCGITLDIFSTITYASPLSIMTLVIKTKSVEFMPFGYHCSPSYAAAFGLHMAFLVGTPFSWCLMDWGLDLGLPNLSCMQCTAKTGVIQRTRLGMNSVRRILKRQMKMKKPSCHAKAPPLISKLTSFLECMIILNQVATD
ncbi:hypothetical protein BT93_D0118 [Corymbia citriodora subsp. variegata]|nr:hypothetical protein BT93_D0118 [Corymbia citriodora subsp. variegata]